MATTVEGQLLSRGSTLQGHSSFTATGISWMVSDHLSGWLRPQLAHIHQIHDSHIHPYSFYSSYSTVYTLPYIMYIYIYCMGWNHIICHIFGGSKSLKRCASPSPVRLLRMKDPSFAWPKSGWRPWVCRRSARDGEFTQQPETTWHSLWGCDKKAPWLSMVLPLANLIHPCWQVGKTKKRKRRKRRRKTSVTRRGECENSPVLMVWFFF